MLHPPGFLEHEVKLIYMLRVSSFGGKKILVLRLGAGILKPIRPPKEAQGEAAHNLAFCNPPNTGYGYVKCRILIV